MEVTRKTRRRARLEQSVFVVLFLCAGALLAWLSTRYHYQADWTAAGRNTLSPASQTLLAQLTGPVNITAFARENELLRRYIAETVGRYQRYKKDVSLTFLNPDTQPDAVRRLGITVDGELLVDYQGRQEKVQDLTEQSLTNALQRVARRAERWLAVLEGHGERSPWGNAPRDLTVLDRELKSKGFHVQGLNLVNDPKIPDNTTVLVIAGPQVNLAPGEVKIIEDYLEKGGSLLWLQDAGSLHGLEPLAEKLGTHFMKGTVVDPVAVQLFGAAFALVGDYGASAVTRGLNAITLFPEAAAIEFKPPKGWEGSPFLETTARSWLETGPLSGEIAFDAGKDVAGPLTIGVTLEREVGSSAPERKNETPKTEAKPGGQGTTQAGHAGAQPPVAEKAEVKERGQSGRKQRVVVVGDGDFLADAYIGNGGNLALALNLFNWLSQDDRLIAVPPKTAPDLTLTLSPVQTVVIGAGVLFALPLLLGGNGLLLWLRRRKR
jgi:gliding motility-associatede transport system auxiliary component